MGITIPAGEGHGAGVSSGSSRKRGAITWGHPLSPRAQSACQPCGPLLPALSQSPGQGSPLPWLHFCTLLDPPAPFAPGFCPNHRRHLPAPNIVLSAQKTIIPPVRCQVPLWPGPGRSFPGTAVPPPAFTTPCEDTLPPFFTCQAHLPGEGHSQITF